MIAGLIEAVASAIFEWIALGFGYLTSLVIVPLISLGRARIQSRPAEEKVRPRWHGLSRDPDGKILMDADTAAVIGLLFWVLVIVIVALYANLAGR